MKIVNDKFSDYHIHSSNYSDGLPTINEIVNHAGKLGLHEIAITDHSQIAVDKIGFSRKAIRSIVQGRWKNVYNDVNVIFGMEADLLNEKGDICDHIQGKKSDFMLLSFHNEIYSDKRDGLTEGFVNAIRKHHKRIKFLGHPFMKSGMEFLDMEKLVKVANHYEIPMELNCQYLSDGRGSMKKLEIMLKNVDQIYVNSDAHTLNELENREKGFKYLNDNGYI